MSNNIINNVLNRLEEKDPIFNTRHNVLQSQAEILRELVPVASDQLLKDSKGQYKTGTAHTLINFLFSAKLYPSYLDFKHEQTRASEESRVLANNLSYTHSMMRKKGDWSEAVYGVSNFDSQGAMYDLIRGEAWIRRYIKKNNDGEPVGVSYEHVPFDQMRGYYGSADVVRVAELTEDKALDMFGEKQVKKVKNTVLWSDGDTVRINENSEIYSQRQEKKTYGYIHYVNSSTKEEYEILGDTVISNFSGDKYRYVYPDGTTYDPYNRRVFNKSIEESHFGYGVLDIVLPVVRVDDTLGNVVMKKAIDDVDPITLVSSDDPNTLTKQFKNHMANRNARSIGMPFFVKGRGTDSKLDVNQIKQSGDYNVYQFIEDFIIKRITMWTGINLEALTDFAPTDSQDQRRQDFQDKVNINILNNNRATDAKFAKEDMIFLKANDTLFHDKVLFYERSKSSFEGSDIDPAELMIDGELPPEEITVRAFLDKIEDLDFDVTPRLEGVLDDTTRQELDEERVLFTLLPPQSKAYAKALTAHLEKVKPKWQISEEDIMPPMPEAPPSPELGAEQPLPPM